MTKPRDVELWPCDYSAACLAPWSLLKIIS